MKFGGLQPGKVCEYFDAVKGGDLWVFQHIPKTAGSSLAAELAANRRPYRNIHIRYGDPGAVPEEQRDVAVEAFLGDTRNGGIRSASGHLRHRNIEQMRAVLPDMRLFTFVRDPVERVVSEYYYCRSSEHNDPEGFARAFPTLEDFASARESNNKMAMYVAGKRNLKPEDLIAYAFERFEFIGTQKLYNLSFRILSTLLWYQSNQEAKVRVSGRSNKRSELPADILNLIRRNNRADAALFRAVSEVYRACRDEIVAELRRRQLARAEA
ncbi:MAG TPA: sulfotransferase family 2 domain-containing protein [Paracoccaceae bacterium]|nr:sulfotransferase family 2 domain-containing protein [Paracoccaceae bacterium]